MKHVLVQLIKRLSACAGKESGFGVGGVQAVLGKGSNSISNSTRKDVDSRRAVVILGEGSRSIEEEVGVLRRM